MQTLWADELAFACSSRIGKKRLILGNIFGKSFEMQTKGENLQVSKPEKSKFLTNVQKLVHLHSTAALNSGDNRATGRPFRMCEAHMMH